MSFFRNNPAYAGCTNIGTDFLSTKLSSQLVRAIQQQLPVITTSIDNGCAKAQLLLEHRYISRRCLLLLPALILRFLHCVVQAAGDRAGCPLYCTSSYLYISNQCLLCAVRSIIAVKKEVDAMGGQVIATRGGMIHLVLQLCRQFEEAFNKAIDGGKGGASLCGNRMLTMMLGAGGGHCRHRHAATCLLTSKRQQDLVHA